MLIYILKILNNILMQVIFFVTIFRWLCREIIFPSIVRLKKFKSYLLIK